MNVDTLLAVILGSGGTGVVGFLIQFYAKRRQGKLESEETLIARINKQSAADTARVLAAEARADKAEEETATWRKQYFDSEERAAYYRAYIRHLGRKVPKWPPDEDDLEFTEG